MEIQKGNNLNGRKHIKWKKQLNIKETFGSPTNEHRGKV
jgi:hypothetical protein